MRAWKVPWAPLLAIMLLAWQPAVGAGEDIRPGDQIDLDGTRCTLGFMFRGLADDADSIYFVTAGHCASHVGQVVDKVGTGRIGTIALIGERDNAAHDYAFIRLDEDLKKAAGPDVRGVSAGAPRGATEEDDILPGDIIHVAGWASTFNTFQVTRNNRGGVLAYYGDNVYGGYDLTYRGDSGAPVTHVSTGRALGIVSGIYGPLFDYGHYDGIYPGVASSGPVIESILVDAAIQGLDLELA